MSEQEIPSFHFGPRERNGAFGGLRKGQAAILIGAVLISMVTVRALPFGPNALVTVGLLSFALMLVFLPVGKRNADEWVSIILSFAFRIAMGQHRWTSKAHLRGHRLDLNGSGQAPEPPLARPPALRRLEFLAASVPGMNGEVGILKEDRTYTGVLSAVGPSFSLMDPLDQARLVVGLGAIQASFGLIESPVKRLQFLETTMPEDPAALTRYAREKIAELANVRTDEELEAVLAAMPEARRACVESYLKGVRDSGPVAQSHECLIALQIDVTKASIARQLRRAGQGGLDRGACEALMRYIAELSEDLEAIEVTPRGMLTPRLLAQHIRFAYDPSARQRRSRLEQAGAEEGEDPAYAGPRAQQEFGDHFRSDGYCHATYHVAEWPRRDVAADFLAPLLLHTKHPRTLSLVIEPQQPQKASREIEKTHFTRKLIGDALAQRGFEKTFRRKAEDEKVERVGQEITQGHVNARYSAYVTVSAKTREDLVWARADIEGRAAESQALELELLWGQQGVAFTYTLPLCRGLTSQ
jgi:hypothetical protein